MSEVRTPLRRLVDLRPKWKLTTDGAVYGIEYDCPCGLPIFDPLYDDEGHMRIGPDERVVGAVPYAQCCQVGGRQVVPTKTHFAGPGLVMYAGSVTHGWDLSGDSFESVTISPSIHAVGHWHGVICDGIVESC